MLSTSKILYPNNETSSNNSYISNMKPHQHLFLSRHTVIRRKGIGKVLEYLTDYLPAIFSHPGKTMEDCDMLSFLHGVLQVYLELWNSSGPFEEYIP